jgi:hypothetical protein
VAFQELLPAHRHALKPNIANDVDCYEYDEAKHN